VLVVYDDYKLRFNGFLTAELEAILLNEEFEILLTDVNVKSFVIPITFNLCKLECSYVYV